MSQAPWSSAWIIWRALFPGGLESAILKTKYPSKATYLLLIHLISTGLVFLRMRNSLYTVADWVRTFTNVF